MSKCESCESKSENGRTVSWILATRIAGVPPSVTMHNVSPLLIHAIIHGKWTSPHPHTPFPPSPFASLFRAALSLLFCGFTDQFWQRAQLGSRRNAPSALYILFILIGFVSRVFLFSFSLFFFFSLSNPVIYTEKKRDVSSASSHSLFDFPRCNAAGPLGGSHFSPPFFSRWKRRKPGEL